ncbi:Potassium voltage-gated channel subfamily H member 1 (Ether-a-go-go potassium channel 1) (EAG channel 1) (EAG1) (r-eag) (Voltage-gated potassium channel subunit Kv10.1) [Durusdinium trenchii]|uniref:Potassium voltage-gated channel subfamily H member 1 (Ether-a-go-go potassium channel 1) (EAG channel 1) (EAG1) (R-eag) (Voltage-gated potassium channel subunit Kv10.1) n=1 Tax=Durusdinium trenchii TaxID=1381693 RepID=A0ABP0LHY5_9DINO
MTSVGYGDLGPKNILERVVCTAIVLVAGLCWAQILGDVCAISSDMNAENQEFRKKMNSLNRMMQEQGLPHDLRRRLRSFFLQNRHQSQYVVRQKLLTNMSPQLQSEVCTEMHLGGTMVPMALRGLLLWNLPWIQKVSFFSQFINHMDRLESKGVDTEAFRACIADTSRQLVCGAFAQRESFGNVQILYILSKGLVILNSKVGTNGTVWGEDFVLADTSLIRPVSGFALTYIEVMALTRESFMKVIERRRVNCPELGQIVRRYCVRIAVRRGALTADLFAIGGQGSAPDRTHQSCLDMSNNAPPGSWKAFVYNVDFLETL